jgi:o-succinylbenzoate synthase
MIHGENVLRVRRCDVFRYRIPFREPLVLGDSELEEREGLLVRLEDGQGNEGWGEAAPLPGFSREDMAEAARQLVAVAHHMEGGVLPVRLWECCPVWWRQHFGQLPAPSVRFGIELAAAACAAARYGATLAGVLAENSADEVPLAGLLTGTPNQVLAEADRLAALGYQAAKLKVGGARVEEDVYLTGQVHRRLGTGVSLRLDANRAWSFHEAVTFVHGCGPHALAYLEEPLCDPIRLREFCSTTGARVALDETLTDLASADLASFNFVAAVVLKPTLLSLAEALRLARQARRRGIEAVISAAFESGVAMRGLIALAAAATPGVAAGLDTYRRLAGDVLIARLPLERPSVSLRAIERSLSVKPQRLERLS